MFPEEFSASIASEIQDLYLKLFKKYFHPARLRLISTEVVFGNRGEYNGRDIQRIGRTCPVL